MKVITKKEQNEIANILHNIWLNIDNCKSEEVTELLDTSIERIDEILKLDDVHIRNENFYHNSLN